ncbi:hypothetical protein KAI92_05310 [Candidatus Parcubacteria bacterium]|nr:hypothetical protein [Candidatus Parcubacteria bacterium]
MKQFYILVPLILILTITGCTKNLNKEVDKLPHNELKKIPSPSKLCSAKQSDVCDRSCTKDEDCHQACPIGCININQQYQLLLGIDCDQIECKCINNQCQPQYKYSEDR